MKLSVPAYGRGAPLRVRRNCQAPMPMSTRPATNSSGLVPVLGSEPDVVVVVLELVLDALDEGVLDVVLEAALEVVLEAAEVLPDPLVAAVPTVKSLKPKDVGAALPPPSLALRPMSAGCSEGSVADPAETQVFPSVL